MLDVIAFLGGCAAFVSIACLIIIKRKAAQHLSSKPVPMIVIQWRGFDRPESPWETIECDRRHVKPSDVHRKTTLDSTLHDYRHDA